MKTIYEQLPQGEVNALSAVNLASILGIDDLRLLRKRITNERQSGALILSSRAGYYRPGNRLELVQYYRIMRKRSFCTLKHLKAVKRKLREWERQEEIKL